MYSVVTNLSVMVDIKKSPYFKTNLGLVNTIEKNGDRVYNDRDKFSFFYNNQYKTTIHGQGNIGDIMFYIDHYIKDPVLAFYYNTEEFIFTHDKKMIEEKGINFYLGHIIKTIETQHEERVKEAELKKIAPIKEADPSLLTKNPGGVTYADIQAYLLKKNSERYLVQEPSDKK